MMARNVINLEEVVREWAWREYDATATASQKKLRRKDKREPRKYLRLELDWSETLFRDVTHWAPLSVDESETTANSVTTNTHGAPFILEPQAAAASRQAIASHCRKLARLASHEFL